MMLAREGAKSLDLLHKECMDPLEADASRSCGKDQADLADRCGAW